MPADLKDSAPPKLGFRVPLDPARLRRARHRIRDYLHEHGALPEATDAIVLAVEEAMTNAVRHSLSSHDLEIGLYFEGVDLVAEIRDRGRGFAIDGFDPATIPDVQATGGRGLYLMAQLMDDLALRSDDGLEVRLVKRGVLGATTTSPGPRRRAARVLG
ncbi:MAG TPA: ATP-binding protein, partial [Thermoleophilia bacterium]|nr:ATP-binding protein [Thermoleophilia bacterium]